VKLFRRTGRITRNRGSGKPTKRAPGIVDAVEAIIKNNPKTCLRDLSQQVNHSVETTISKKNLHLHPYRMISELEELAGGPAQRLQV
jgi:hypothetical protein